MAIFKHVWKTISFLREVTANILFLGIIALITLFVVGFVHKYHSGQNNIKKSTDTILFDLKGIISENEDIISSKDMVFTALSGNKIPKFIALRNIVDTLEYAKKDPNIKKIIFKIDKLKKIDATKAIVIANCINELKKAHKQVIVWSTYYSQNELLLASNADVWLDPIGMVDIAGLSTTQLYMKDFFTRLGIEFYIFRVGKYKSAVEMFSRNNMSMESKSMYAALLSDLWRSFSKKISANRNIPLEVLNNLTTSPETYWEKYSNNGARLSSSGAILAEKLGLVDKLVDFNNLSDTVFNPDSNTDWTSYLAINKAKQLKLDSSKNKIAIITLSGSIVPDSTSSTNSIKPTSTIELIRKARSSDIKAVVVRIDSPGGGVFESEIIRRELAILEKLKPVVISMSSVTASGGYWISTAAQKIVAEPTTITGSIGVFGIVPNLSGSIEKLSINANSVSFPANFSKSNMFEALPENTAHIMQLGVNDLYSKFINLVAKSRNLTTARVDEIAQGRVFSGKKALEYKLVDMLGNEKDAIILAAKLANLKDYQVFSLHKKISKFQKFLANIATNTKSSSNLGEIFERNFLTKNNLKFLEMIFSESETYQKTYIFSPVVAP